MDLALLQMPMVLFTTLVPMASGAFVGLALAFLGIAHTYMAAEALAKAGDKLGLPTKVETTAPMVPRTC